MDRDLPEGFARFSFTGSGGEYFRIWIVNLLLTVCTLGIYSAWAKVRREQYFHRNTLLEGSGFDYHGKPSAILKGRLIAVGLFAVLSITQKFSPLLYGLLVLVAIPIVPWFIQRSLRFRAANTSYRGLRFRHRGTYTEALAAHVGHGVLTVLTAGIWMPMWARAAKRFQLGKLAYGEADFTCEPSAKSYYGTYFKAFLMLIAVAVLTGILAAILGTGMNPRTSPMLFALVPLTMMLGFSLLVRPYIKITLTNLSWNATAADGRRFASVQSLGSYWKLHATNVLLTLLTLGLYWPWAQVREVRYRVEHTLFDAAGLDEVIGAGEQQASAVGEEVAEVFDLDLAL